MTTNNKNQTIVYTKGKTPKVRQIPQEKYCPRCEETHPADDFYINAARKTGLTSWCRKCFRDKSHKYAQRQKQRDFKPYSNGKTPLQCAICGETDIDKLCLDHLNGGGNAHRRRAAEKTGKKKCVGAAFWKYLREEHYPNDPELQVLCKECNKKKQRENHEYRTRKPA